MTNKQMSPTNPVVCKMNTVREKASPFCQRHLGIDGLVRGLISQNTCFELYNRYTTVI
jgi:hypothetical protein